MNDDNQLYRTAFEADNARNIGVQDLSRQFVWTNDFEKLLSPKNHIILGARGSGKTALVKMVSHEYLSRYDDDRAKSIIKSKRFIGIYVPMKLEWVGGLNNKPWQTEGEAELFFQWRLNIATCMAFLTTLESCLDSYVEDKDERIMLEYKIITSISKSWFDSVPEMSSIDELKNKLEDTEFDKQKQSLKNRVTKPVKTEKIIGESFELELFSPLKQAIKITKRHMKFPNECYWLLCLDEAEFLSEFHHRILNSHLRTYSGEIVFKITTMPYHHHTIETNTKASLTVGDDFEYVYIDQPVNVDSNTAIRQVSDFTNSLFDRRLSQLVERTGLKLSYLLGTSELLGDTDSNWSNNSRLWKLLKRYASGATIQRAERLKNTKEFKDQIARKIQGSLILRDAVSKTSGRSQLNIYSGENVFIRCGDGNPRRIIRLLNGIMNSVRFTETDKRNPIGFLPIPKKTQNAVMLKVSGNTLNLAKLEPKVGDQLFELIQTAGNYMKAQLLECELGTDHISSIEIREVNEKDWNLIKKAVAWGLLFPNINENNPDPLPNKSGIFRLAFILSPHFRIMPRKGKSVPLRSIYAYQDRLL